MAKRATCKGKKANGQPCRARPRRDADYCARHAHQAPKPRDTGRTPKTRGRKRRAPAEDWRPKFLAALEEEITVIAACRAASVARSTVYEERRASEEFAAAWDEVEERSTQELEREAFRRAYEGWIEREEFFLKDDGEKVPTLTVRKFSDTLMIFLLKARRPAVYRERVEHTGPGGGPIEHRARVDLSGLNEEQLAALEAIQPKD